MSRIDLSQVTTGPISRPYSVVLYGPEGIGKTSFAASAPSPVFIPTESGSDRYDVSRFPVCKTWGEVMDAVKQLRDESHQYKTVVLDTIDGLEPLIIEAVCRSGGKQTLKEFGWGAGDELVGREWMLLLSLLDQLIDKGIHVVLLAHHEVKRFHDPESGEYDRYRLALGKVGENLVKAWPECLFFANYKTFAKRENGSPKARGFSDNERRLYTQRTAAFDAKNRFRLPEEIPFPKSGAWESFENAAKGHNVDQLPKLLKAIAAMYAAAGPELERQAVDKLEQAGGDIGKVKQVGKWLKSQIEGKS